MNIKKISFILSILYAFGSFSVYSSSFADIKINGKFLKTQANPIITEGTVLAPARDISGGLGYRVEWNDKKRRVVISNKEKEIVITPGKDSVSVNGIEEKMPAKARIVDNRTFIPVRFIAEETNATVLWKQESKTVDISKDGHVVADEYIKPEYNKEDVEWLARIVNAEAAGEPFEGKIGVANVVLNRVKSREFPNTIYNVIFDRKYGVQFTPVANGTIYNNPNNDSYQAAKSALSGTNVVGESLYFCNPIISTNFWIVNNRTFLKSIGKHDFYL